MTHLTAAVRDKRSLFALRPSYYVFSRAIAWWHPSLYCPGIGYIVNDARLAKAIMKDNEHFSIVEAGGLGALIAELWGDTPMLLSMDGKEHQRVKFALLESFKPDALQRTLAHELHELTANLESMLREHKTVDIARYTRLHTLKITSSLLGRPEVSDEELFATSELITKVMGYIKLTHQSYSRSDRAKAKVCVEALRRIAADYYHSPDLTPDSLITKLGQLGYSEEKTYGFITMFLVAGTVTVSSSFPRLLALLLDTSSFATLKAKPELLESTLNEAFRFIAPGTTSLYGIKQTTVIEGRTYKKGRRVIISLYNILHDTRYTSKPNTFILDRTQHSEIQGLWFGTGAHFCMGSVLAKLEISSLLQMLCSLDGTLHITERHYRKVGVYPGYEKLLLRLSKS